MKGDLQAKKEKLNQVLEVERAKVVDAQKELEAQKAKLDDVIPKALAQLQKLVPDITLEMMAQAFVLSVDTTSDANTSTKVNHWCFLKEGPLMLNPVSGRIMESRFQIVSPLVAQDLTKALRVSARRVSRFGWMPMVTDWLGATDSLAFPLHLPKEREILLSNEESRATSEWRQPFPKGKDVGAARVKTRPPTADWIRLLPKESKGFPSSKKQFGSALWS
ncbi:hypothetical protein Cgig2_009201 [Carnegiea gigantea]|uniref:Uncharacterized protein n=1 Tax=Carnegiea gigantea TaxID=171969 RepID=A0A9Q1JLS9_9CARY|nr:hypothetical protein Cgig2_009201 [Carnegiea gigantea]